MVAKTVSVCALCLLAAMRAAGQSQPAAGAAAGVDPAAYQTLLRENLELRRAVERLKEEGEALRKQNAALLLEIQALEQRQTTLTALLAESRTNEELKSDVERLEREKAALLAEVARLRQELERAIAARAASLPSAPLPGPAPGSDLYRRLEQENADLRQQLSRAQEATQTEMKTRAALAEQQRTLEARLAQLGAEMAKLQASLREARAQEQREREALLKVARKAREYQQEARRLAEELAEAQAAARPSRSPPPAGRARFTRPNGSPVEPQDDTGAITNCAALVGLAAKRMRTRQYAEAEQAYLQALALEPRNAAVHYALGVLYADYLRKPDRAVVHLQRYLELNPTAPDRDLVRAWLVELDVRRGW